MKGDPSLIPARERQKSVSEPRTDTRYDHFAAEIRRLKARMSEVELQLSTQRRDMNRIDKKVYRDTERHPSIETKEPVEAQLSDALFH